jgi:hypothetical protein
LPRRNLAAAQRLTAQRRADFKFFALYFAQVSPELLGFKNYL